MNASTRNRLTAHLRAHHGVITRAEALSLGATEGTIRHLVASGAWRRTAAGVYTLAGLPPTALLSHARALAAAGPGAMLSHRSAAWLWDLIDDPPPRVELTVPAHRRPRVAGAVVHRGDTFALRQVRQGLGVTDPVRTLIDLAASAPPVELAVAVDRALAGALSLTTLPRLEAATTPDSTSRRRGVGALRRTLEQQGYLGGPEPSVLERKMALLFRWRRLPLPAVEVAWFEGHYRLDYAYPDLKLAIEVNGYVWHRTPEHARHDHARHNQLQSHAWTILVYTWKDVIGDADRVADEIAANWSRLAA